MEGRLHGEWPLLPCSLPATGWVAWAVPSLELLMLSVLRMRTVTSFWLPLMLLPWRIAGALMKRRLGT